MNIHHEYFPPSPKVLKGKGKKLARNQKQEDPSTDSDVTMVMSTQMQEFTVSGPQPLTLDSDGVIQPLGFITERRKRKMSSSCRKSDGLCNKVPEEKNAWKHFTGIVSSSNI